MTGCAVAAQQNLIVRRTGNEQDIEVTMLKGRSLLLRGTVCLVMGVLALFAASVQAQTANRSATGDAIATRLFVEWLLDQAGRSTTSLPALHSDLPADLKLGIAFRAQDRQLLESRVSAFKTGVAIAAAVVKGGDAVGVWVGTRAKARPELSRREAENETLVNEGFTADAAAGAVLAQALVRQTIGTELSALEREFRLAVEAAVSKDAGLAVLARTDASDPKLAASRAQVRRLLAAAAAKK